MVWLRIIFNYSLLSGGLEPYGLLVYILVNAIQVIMDRISHLNKNVDFSSYYVNNCLSKISGGDKLMQNLFHNQS